MNWFLPELRQYYMIACSLFGYVYCWNLLTLANTLGKTLDLYDCYGKYFLAYKFITQVFEMPVEKRITGMSH